MRRFETICLYIQLSAAVRERWYLQCSAKYEPLVVIVFLQKHDGQQWNFLNEKIY